MSRPKTILITGCAGFIGYHLAQQLLSENYLIMGIDQVNNYYDIRLKEARLQRLKEHPNFLFERISIEDLGALEKLFSQAKIDIVIHLAAQAGVRYSLENPHAYIHSNIVGFMNILECCRIHGIEHLLFASSSSVYGANKKIPFSTEDQVDHPVSLYAATKRSNELMAHTYSHLYQLPVTGLRFFTVYGPWGRPDMSYFKFTKAIFEEKPIQIFNYGRMKRDFTYIDDIIEGILRLLNRKPSPILSSNLLSHAPYKIYNIGNNRPVELMKFISVIEEKIGKQAKKEFLPMQAGDVPETYADVEDLINDIGFQPKTSIEDGIGKFIEWYREFYKV